MATTVTYRSNAGLWTFRNPSITVTETAVPSLYGHSTQSIRRNFTVRGIVVAASAAELQQIEINAHNILQATGGSFVWDENGVQLFKADPTSDINFGPHSTGFAFERFIGANCALVSWSLSTEVQPGANTDITELVYSISTNVDQALYSQRTIAGTMRLNGSRFNRSTFVGADCYRSVLDRFICPCPTNWQRVSRNFDVSPDGLSLTFMIVDRQRFITFPTDIMDGSATLHVSGSPRRTTIKRFALSGFFEAHPEAPGAERTAFANLAASLFSINVDSKAFRVEEMSLDQELYTPRLGFRMEWSVFLPDNLTSDSADMNTQSGRIASWMLALLSRGNNWIKRFRQQTQTDPGMYGTTIVRGWCGHGPILAPNLAAPEHITQANQAPPPGSNTGESGVGPDRSSGDETGDQYYLYFQQSFKYKTDFGVNIYGLAKEATPDVVEQVRNPRTYLVITGEAHRYDTPAFPSKLSYPVITNEAQAQTPGIYLLKGDSSVSAPTSNGLYITSWKYLCYVKWGETSAMPETLRLPYSPFAKDRYQNAETNTPVLEMTNPFYQKDILS